MICIFVFYSEARGKQTKFIFSKYFKHVDVFTFQGKEWIIHRMDGRGINYKVSTLRDSHKIISALKRLKTVSALIGISCEERANYHWSPLMGRTCNELTKYVAGIKIGLTFNPRHLYNKLLKYSVNSNYDLLYWWRR